MADAVEWQDVCWICLQSSSEAPQSTPLVYPCACPRPAHEGCLARWQLHCAGREEESCCRFCKQTLPHWRQAFKARSSSQPQVAPLMSIQFHGRTYWLQVHTGQGGVEQFKANVKRLLDLRGEDEFDITFECQVPGEGGKLELHGLEAFDAAVYCASLTAAERLAAPSDDSNHARGAHDTGTADNTSISSISTPDAAQAAGPATGTPGGGTKEQEQDRPMPVVSSSAATSTSYANNNTGTSSGPLSSSSSNSSGSRSSSSSGSSSSSRLDPLELAPNIMQQQLSSSSSYYTADMSTAGHTPTRWVNAVNDLPSRCVLSNNDSSNNDSSNTNSSSSSTARSRWTSLMSPRLSPAGVRVLWGAAVTAWAWAVSVMPAVNTQGSHNHP